MRKQRMCMICGKRPPTVPDRDSGSPRKRLCGECHAQRLKGDFRRIALAAAKREEARDEVS